jgi:hypothetical protein
MIKTAIINLVLTIVTAIIILFAPPPNSKDVLCGKYCSHNDGQFGHMIIDDANEFVRNAGSPDLILEENALRQNRPAYIAAAAISGRIFVFWDRYLSPIKPNPYFLGYILLNLVFLWVTLMLINLIFKELNITNKYFIYGVLVITLFNPVVKVFFWTAHQQMLTMLVPFLAIYLMVIIINRTALINVKNTIITSFIAGLLVLLYGSFPIVYLAAIIAMFLQWKYNIKFCSFNRLLTLIIIASIIFILPNLIWVQFCKYKIGSYYHWETEYWRQYVWVIDAYKQSSYDLILACYKYFLTFAKTLVEIIPFCIVIIISILRKSHFEFDIKEKTLLKSFLILNTAIFFLLLFMGGVYKPRMTWNLVPVLLLMTVIISNSKHKTSNIMNYGFLTFSLIYAIYVVVSHGPFC